MSSTTDNIRLIQRLYDELWTNGELDIIDELYTPDYTAAGFSISDEPIERDRFKLVVNAFQTAFPDAEYRLTHLIGMNEWVGVRWEVTGTHEGEFFGLASSNREISYTGTALYHVTDGKCTGSWANWDALGLVKQLDADPTELGLTGGGTLR